MKRQLQLSLLEALSTPTVVVNLKTKKFVYCNSAFEELSGYPLAAVKKLRWSDFFDGTDDNRARALYEVFSENGGEITEYDLSFRKKSGRRLAVNLFAKTMPQPHARHIVLVSIHDLSHLKKLQSEKEKAMREISHISKLADIGRLAAGVAHELNNPLMVIQGFAENIEASLVDQSFSADELKWQLSPILKATDKMAKIISQLTRMSRDDEKMSLVSVHLSEIVEDVLRLANKQLLYNDVELIRDYDSQLVVRCDPNQIEQIILNILNNAVHALTKKQKDRKITVRVKDKDGQSVVSIHNNGPSIPENIKDKIMTPFFTTKEVGEGTGLGLSVSYGIMKAHGGDLTFESKKGAGTEFHLVFPALEDGVALTDSSRAIGLVVEDEQFPREIIVNKLRRYGFKILESENGEEALKILKSRRDIDFVFTDAKMPVMDGATLVKNIRAENKSMLIFAVSGFTGIRSIEAEFKKYGINGFLAKPLDQEKFAACVQQILRETKRSKKTRRAA